MKNTYYDWLNYENVAESSMSIDTLNQNSIILTLVFSEIWVGQRLLCYWYHVVQCTVTYYLKQRQALQSSPYYPKKCYEGLSIVQ